MAVKEKEALENKSRRELLVGAAALAATVTAAGAAQAQTHSNHSGHTTSDGRPPLLEAALDCIETGRVCAAYCIARIREGDTTLAKCLASVNETTASCDALSHLAAARSNHLAAFAEVCRGICSDCEAECRKHEEHHEACRACAEACKTCIGEIDAFLQAA